VKCSPKAKKEANKTALRQQACGYDCVIPAGHNVHQCIYWVPGSAVLLAAMELRMTKRCEICIDDKLPDEGCECTAGHFVCWDCFDQNVRAAKEVEATRRTVDVVGRVKHPPQPAKLQAFLPSIYSHLAKTTSDLQYYDFQYLDKEYLR
jgi:hypothetical protein